jgi:hypothetical protein
VDERWRSAAASQFESAIEMLGDALSECSDELWRATMWEDPSMPGFSEFWYVAYHTLFWLDLYLSESRDGFAPPAPFTLGELEPAVLPPRVYTREELQHYLAHSAEKCRATFENLTDEQAGRVLEIGSERHKMTFAELLLYNMGHVREHEAQLSMFLGQRRGEAST